MKKKIIRIVAIVLCILMLVSLVPVAVIALAEETNGAYDLPFTDVKPDDYFFEPVIWAYDEGVTTGTSATKFAPDATCTRGQVVTFIWRAMGEPEPESNDNKFEDVKATDYFYKAVLWAVEQGITTGTSEKRFSPDTTCTNAHIITFIWRALGEPDKTGNGEWYADSVNWANASGLTAGTYAGDFDVNAGCPRANVVTYLYRHIEKNTATVYVSASADAATADGSAQKPFTTIEAARDYVRTLDKEGKTAVKVRINNGTYFVKNTITFEKEDAGLKWCPIKYIGEKNTVITGGVTFSSDDFTAATGSAVQHFKDAAKANIVQIDLKQFGFTKADIASIYTNADGSLVHNINGHIPLLYAGGKLATVCRYPNDCYAVIDSGVINSPNGAADARDLIDTTTITVADEFVEEMNSWHDISKVFVRGRFSLLWCDDNSRIISLDGKTLTLPFAGGYDPRPRMFFVCQNAPEMLDAPGEYYIDDDAILYYYKDADFAGEEFSIPFTDTLIDIKSGADSIMLQNLTIESAKGDIMKSRGNYFTMLDCEVRDSSGWVDISGYGLMIDSCYFHDFTDGIMKISGGDCDNLIPSGNLVLNNEFYNWGILGRVYNEAIRIDKACGVTVSHNEIHDTPHMAVGWTGNNNVIEYNEIYDVCNDTDDAGAVYSYNGYCDYGNVFRYNYIHDVRAKDEVIMNVPDYPYCHVSGIYWDGGKSGQTAEYNILENISGAGVIGSGRDEVVTNNLFISCGWGVDMSAWYYNGTFNGTGQGNGGGKSHQGFAGQENNEAWKKAFPGLYKLKWEMSTADADDPDYFVAPAGNKVLNNYYYFDKANVKSLKSYGHLFQNSIDQAVYKFSGDNIVDAQEGVNQKTYTSKRSPISVEEAIEQTSAITGITMEEFEKIGRYK